MTAFAALHATGTFVLPNPWDVGSARLLEALGFPALATTSSGFAGTLGRRDQHVTRDELLRHVEDLVAAVEVPVSADAEDGYAGDAEGVARTVGLMVDAGAAGCSIEDWDAGEGRIRPLPEAVERVAAAVEAAGPDVVVTARCEHHLYGVDDLDATVERLVAYAGAGAGCIYAPGLTAAEDIRRVVEIGTPVNVLAVAGGPTVGDLTALGVRRVSVGGALAYAAYGAAVGVARGLLDGAGMPADPIRVPGDVLRAAWGA